MNLKNLLKRSTKQQISSNKNENGVFNWYVGDVRLESADVRQAPQRGSKAAGRKQARAKTFRALRLLHLETR